MIINSSILDEKIDRKLFPRIFLTKVSFLCFINSDNNNGLVLYSNDEFWKPYYFMQAEKLKKLKLKDRTYRELVAELNKLLPHDKKLIKRAKTEFFDEFETEVQAGETSSFYELNLVDEEVVCTKHIVCILSHVEELERTFNRENFKTEIIPYEKLKKYKEKTIENWLMYFLTHAGEFI